MTAAKHAHLRAGSELLKFSPGLIVIRMFTRSDRLPLPISLVQEPCCRISKYVGCSCDAIKRPAGIVALPRLEDQRRQVMRMMKIANIRITYIHTCVAMAYVQRCWQIRVRLNTQVCLQIRILSKV
jgi:hypothetical protein